MAGLGYNNANTTFSLISSDTAYLNQAKVSSTGYVAPATWDAGQIGYFNGSGQMIVVDASAANTSKFRVLASTKTSAQDDTLPTGTVAYVDSDHIGRTTKFNADITSASTPGVALFVDTNGVFCGTASTAKVTSCPVVATLNFCDGTWLEYRWLHVGATPTS